MNERLIIIGASGHGKVVADIAELSGYKEIAFLDDDRSKKSNGKYKVIGTCSDIDKFIDDHDFFVAIGNNKIRKRITQILSDKDIIQPVLIHPNAIVDKTVLIKEGTVVMANAVINADTMIGKGCIINTASSVDHDCMIKDYVHISPGVHIAGTVKVGENTWVGTGTSVINNISIADDCIIGAGTVVIDDISNCGTYVGAPARMVRK